MRGSGFRRATACAKTVATTAVRVPAAANRECARMSGDDWLARGAWTRHGAAWQDQRKTRTRKGTDRCSTEPAERRRSEGQPPEGGHDDSRRTRRRLGRARDAALKTQKDKPASSSREGSARGSHQHPVAPRRTAKRVNINAGRAAVEKPQAETTDAGKEARWLCGWPTRVAEGSAASALSFRLAMEGERRWRKGGRSAACCQAGLWSCVVAGCRVIRHGGRVDAKRRGTGSGWRSLDGGRAWFNVGAVPGQRD
ncbi:hypothetical protein ERJ75_001630500 [Trypanosoma vivax]|nr:hypothetical protein ERJ75_001630500 [Trypanosoma vivax]